MNATEEKKSQPELEYAIWTRDSAGYEQESLEWGRTDNVEHATEAVKLLNERADELKSGLHYRVQTVEK